MSIAGARLRMAFRLQEQSVREGKPASREMLHGLIIRMWPEALNDASLDADLISATGKGSEIVIELVNEIESAKAWLKYWTEK